MKEQIFEQISNDIKSAMKSRDKIALETLRSIKKEFIEAKTAKDSIGVLEDEQAIKIMQKMVKQRKETATIYAEQQRPELAEKENAEAAVIQKYLPTQMNDEELTVALQTIINELGITDIKEIGKLMGVATKKLAGKIDGKSISNKAKQLLS